MGLTIDDFVTHYILSSHPRNKAIVDIKDKTTGKVRYIKIRHRLPEIYAISLVDPITFEVWAETQVKSAAAKIKPIILRLDNRNDTIIDLRDSSRIGFEWSFVWEGEKYKWVRESRLSNSLECKAIRKTGDIRVAQYLPRMLKDEYFGIFSLLGYNLLRCNLTKTRELELILLMSLMTLLDKSNDGGWKRDPISTGAQDDNPSSINQTEYNSTNPGSNNNSNIVSSIAYEDPIPSKALQKKYKVELSNDQKLQLMLEKDVRRSQKQIQSDQKYHRPCLSAGNSPAHSPKVSPLPTPSTSTHTPNATTTSTTNVNRSPRLARQKSASALPLSTQDTYLPPTPPTSNQSNSGPGRLSRLFSGLSIMKQTGKPSNITPVNSKTTSPVGKNAKKSSPNSVDDSCSNKTNEAVSQRYKDQQKIHREKKQRKQQIQQQQIQQQQIHQQQQMEQEQMEQEQMEQEQYEFEHSYPYYDHHLSLPTGQISHLTDEFGNLSTINNYDSPPSLRSIRWNPEQPSPIVTNNYVVQAPPAQSTYHAHRSNSHGSRRPRMDNQRRMSASEYPLYISLRQHHYNNYNSNNQYPTSEYYPHVYHQQQQHEQSNYYS